MSTHLLFSFYVVQEMVSQLLIENCIKNERASQGKLYSACAPYVYTIVKSYVNDDSYVKDVMQDAFAAIFKSIKNFKQERGNFKSWIAQITIRKCIDHLKTLNRITLTTNLEALDSISDNDYEELNQLSKEDIEQMLSKMPTGYRTIFMLSVIDEYPHTEIAELLDISPETSRSQLHRSMKWIKKNIFQSSNKCRYEAF